MNRAELRRFIVVVLPFSVLVALAASAAVTIVSGTGPAGEPRINDHWHASYQVYICGERQPNFSLWESGVHTHGDGIIHIHPFQTFEEGPGSRLVKFFEYGGGELTQTEMQLPGTRLRVGNGDECPDGSAGILQVSVNEKRLADWMEYIPADGDRIVITFGPEP
jgi:hypothetical protein